MKQIVTLLFFAASIWAMPVQAQTLKERSISKIETLNELIATVITSYSIHYTKLYDAYVAQSLAEKFSLSGNKVKQDNKNMNYGLRVNYAFDNKYVVEASSSYMSSDRLTKDQRWKLYGAGALGWIMSNEDFMSSIKGIDYLKLKASYGKMGYDESLDYYLDRDEYGGGGNVQSGINNAYMRYGQVMNKMGNSYNFV